MANAQSVYFPQIDRCPILAVGDVVELTYSSGNTYIGEVLTVFGEDRFMLLVGEDEYRTFKGCNVTAFRYVELVEDRRPMTV